MESLVDHIPFR